MGAARAEWRLPASTQSGRSGVVPARAGERDRRSVARASPKSESWWAAPVQELPPGSRLRTLALNSFMKTARMASLSSAPETDRNCPCESRAHTTAQA
jgi:hypothetical protein